MNDTHAIAIIAAILQAGDRAHLDTSVGSSEGYCQLAEEILTDAENITQGTVIREVMT